jgi:hypothetical protein
VGDGMTVEILGVLIAIAAFVLFILIGDIATGGRRIPRPPPPPKSSEKVEK